MGIGSEHFAMSSQRAGVSCGSLLLAPVFAAAQVCGLRRQAVGQARIRAISCLRCSRRSASQQHLNQQLPLDAAFVDETGNPVQLGDYFGKHPAILALVYYNCPMLCSEELDGLTSALEMVHLTPGKDFDVVVVSIDPSETPEMAAH